MTADPAGRFAVRVPYWTRARASEVGVANGYRIEVLRADRRRARLLVIRKEPRP